MIRARTDAVIALHHHTVIPGNSLASLADNLLRPKLHPPVSVPHPAAAAETPPHRVRGQ